MVAYTVVREQPTSPVILDGGYLGVEQSTDLDSPFEFHHNGWIFVNKSLVPNLANRVHVLNLGANHD